MITLSRRNFVTQPLFAAGWCSLNTQAPMMRSRRTITPAPLGDRRVGIAYTMWFADAKWPSHWGTPQVGFYASDNVTVIRKHADWLAAANIDFIMIDWSNNSHTTPNHRVYHSTSEKIERATDILFQQYHSLRNKPQIALMIGLSGDARAPQNGQLQKKADHIFAKYISHPSYRDLYYHHQRRPLLTVYVGTPSPYQKSVPRWSDPRFAVRYMTGFLSNQYNLVAGQVSKYGYWSWEDRGALTYPIRHGRPEVVTVVASWRGHPRCPSPGRNNGQTFTKGWEAARAIGPEIVLISTFNEWARGEQPNAEHSKDVEPSQEFGMTFLNLIRDQGRLYRAGK